MSWKTADDVWKNESFWTSAATRGSVHPETVGFSLLRDLYSKAIHHPKTQPYLKHMYITCHPVKNSSYNIQLNCNNCRSFTQLMMIDSCEPSERQEAYDIA